MIKISYSHIMSAVYIYSVHSKHIFCMHEIPGILLHLAMSLAYRSAHYMEHCVTLQCTQHISKIL